MPGLMTVEVAAPQVMHGGLVEVLDGLGRVHDNSDPHLGLGIVFDQPLCGVAALAPGLCDDALGIDPDTEKSFDSPMNDEALAFAIYKGIECSPFYKDYESKTTDALKRGAYHAVERGYQALVLDEASVVSGGPYSVVAALARAEEIIGVQGGGVISVSRFGAAYLAAQRGVKSDDLYHLYTAQGTPIINGGGISRAHDGTTPTGEGFFIWVTAAVDLYRGPIEYSQGADLTTNTERGLAEQVYSMTTPCFAYAIQVNPVGGTP